MLSAISAGYEELNSPISVASFERCYLGFSFVVPATEDDREQQKFYSKVFRSINIGGKKLLPIESREALYYLNTDLVDLFTPEFSRKITVNEGKMDFVRYLSMLSQYAKNNGPDKIAYGFTKIMENYYENFIYAVVDEKETKEFKKISDIVKDFKYEARMEKLKTIIEGMGLIKNYDSIINLDTYMFGLVYITIFEDKTVAAEKYTDLHIKIGEKIDEFKEDSLHVKNPSALKHLKLRIQGSICICKEFES